MQNGMGSAKIKKIVNAFAVLFCGSAVWIFERGSSIVSISFYKSDRLCFDNFLCISMRLDVEQLERPLYGGADQQREDQGADAGGSAEQPSDGEDDQLHSTARHP